MVKKRKAKKSKIKRKRTADEEMNKLIGEANPSEVKRLGDDEFNKMNKNLFGEGYQA